MKKIGFSVLVFFFLLPVVFAKTINFKTSMMMDYPYMMNETSEIPIMYMNNETDNYIYNIDPINRIEYKEEYNEIQNAFYSINEEDQLKIKKYIRFTKNETDLLTRYRYYVCTQILIWKIYHPELNIMENDMIKEYTEKLESKSISSPSWLQNYEIEETLILKKDSQYKLSSNDCEIKEEDSNWVINHCKEKSVIKLTEAINEEISFYEKDNVIVGIEGYDSPFSWDFEITVKEKEIKEPEKEEEKNPEEEKKPDIKEEEKKEELPKTEEKTDNDQKEEQKSEVSKAEEPIKKDEISSQKEIIENVPNTKETNHNIKGSLILICFILWKKRKLFFA